MTKTATNGASVGPRRRWIQGAIVAAATFVIGLAVTEVVLRWLEVPFPASWIPSENAMARFDPDLGWSYIPGRSYVQEFGSARRPVEIHFDGLGARVPTAQGSRDPALPTILFIGGSYTMGHGLPYEETFVGVIDADPSLPYQVVNLGVQGYGTDQALLVLQRYIGSFRTVAVVYTFIDDHVLRNATADRRLIMPDARFLGTKPRFDLGDDGEPYPAERPARYDDMFQLQLWNWVRLARFQNGPRPGPELTRALIARMRDVAEARGARFVMVYWRQDIRYPGADSMTMWKGPLRVGDLGIQPVDTGADAPPDWDDWVIPGDFHPDARAHARVAALLRERLHRLGLAVDTPPAGAGPPAEGGR